MQLLAAMLTEMMKEQEMNRLPFFAVLIAGSIAAFPAAAQQTVVEGEKINQVIVYGDDKCEASSAGEIVVCSRLPESERFRVPQIFRGNPLDPRNEAWANKVVALERVGRFGTDSCSPVGLGGFTGCTQALVSGAKAERRAADKTDWQTMIADERAKRLAGIDSAAAQVEAAVVAEERALEERRRAAEELERQASGVGPAPTASDDPSGMDPLPQPTPR
jgi:hypothetical protein